MDTQHIPGKMEPLSAAPADSKADAVQRCQTENQVLESDAAKMKHEKERLERDLEGFKNLLAVNQQALAQVPTPAAGLPGQVQALRDTLPGIEALVNDHERELSSVSDRLKTAREGLEAVGALHGCLLSERGPLANCFVRALLAPTAVSLGKIFQEIEKTSHFAADPAHQKEGKEVAEAATTARVSATATPAVGDSAAAQRATAADAGDEMDAGGEDQGPAAGSKRLGRPAAEAATPGDGPACDSQQLAAKRRREEAAPAPANQAIPAASASAAAAVLAAAAAVGPGERLAALLREAMPGASRAEALLRALRAFACQGSAEECRALVQGGSLARLHACLRDDHPSFCQQRQAAAEALCHIDELACVEALIEAAKPTDLAWIGKEVSTRGKLLSKAKAIRALACGSERLQQVVVHAGAARALRAMLGRGCIAAADAACALASLTRHPNVVTREMTAALVMLLASDDDRDIAAAGKALYTFSSHPNAAFLNGSIDRLEVDRAHKQVKLANIPYGRRYGAVEEIARNILRA